MTVGETAGETAGLAAAKEGVRVSPAYFLPRAEMASPSSGGAPALRIPGSQPSIHGWNSGILSVCAFHAAGTCGF